MVAAGFAAGAINSVIGSGGLVTFPTLLAVGYSPVTANVANSLGLVPGSATGVYGYRRELAGQQARVRTLAAGSVLGSLVGATLLLTLPSSVFDAVVPLLVLLACGLMALQPRLAARVAQRRAPDARDVGPLAVFLVFLTGIYGGYFGAAQSVILLSILAVLVPDDLRRSNALKTVLAGIVNAVAAVVFILFAEVAWAAVGLLALGSSVGGATGASLGRRIPPAALRLAVITLGIGVAVSLLLS